MTCPFSRHVWAVTSSSGDALPADGLPDAASGLLSEPADDDGVALPEIVIDAFYLKPGFADALLEVFCVVHL